MMMYQQRTRALKPASSIACAGVSLVEVIVAIVIIFLVSIFSSIAVTQLVETRSVMLHDTRMLYLAEEGYELVRFIRDDDWEQFAALDTDNPHYLAIGSSTIAVTTDPEVVASTYQRSFFLRHLYRDSAGIIVTATTSGATLDPAGRIVEVVVTDGRSTTTVQSILFDIFSE